MDYYIVNKLMPHKSFQGEPAQKRHNLKTLFFLFFIFFSFTIIIVSVFDNRLYVLFASTGTLAIAPWSFGAWPFGKINIF